MTPLDGQERDYEVEMTIHETGIAVVSAKSVKDALEGLRSGRLSWTDFNQTENPIVGYKAVRLPR